MGQPILSPPSFASTFSFIILFCSSGVQELFNPEQRKPQEPGLDGVYYINDEPRLHAWWDGVVPKDSSDCATDDATHTEGLKPNMPAKDPLDSNQGLKPNKPAKEPLDSQQYVRTYKVLPCYSTHPVWVKRPWEWPFGLSNSVQSQFPPPSIWRLFLSDYCEYYDSIRYERFQKYKKKKRDPVSPPPPFARLSWLSLMSLTQTRSSPSDMRSTFRPSTPFADPQLPQNRLQPPQTPPSTAIPTSPPPIPPRRPLSSNKSQIPFADPTSSSTKRKYRPLPPLPNQGCE